VKDAKDAKDVGAAGFGFLLAALPELLRRAADMDRTCGNCGNWLVASEQKAPCIKLLSDVVFPADGPPWRECRWFEPSVEYKQRQTQQQAQHPPTRIVDLLREMGDKGKKPRTDD
jgi:hypothetical protein